MRIKLSSNGTFIAKVLMPAGVIGLLSFVTIALFAKLGIQPPTSGPDDGKWVLLVATIIVAALLYFSNMRLKEVWIDDEALYVSNFLREVRVDLRSVESVQRVGWGRQKHLMIRLERDCGFGRRVFYFPKRRLFTLFQDPCYDSAYAIMEAVERAKQRDLGRVSP